MFINHGMLALLVSVPLLDLFKRKHYDGFGKRSDSDILFVVVMLCVFLIFGFSLECVSATK